MNDEELAKLAKRHVEARVGLVVHAVMDVVVNTGIVITWRLTGASYPWFIWPLLGWGAGLIAHVVTYWFGPDSVRGENAIEREMQRLRHARHE
jgi:hypothetical protein